MVRGSVQMQCLHCPRKVRGQVLLGLESPGDRICWRSPCPSPASCGEAVYEGADTGNVCPFAFNTAVIHPSIKV